MVVVLILKWMDFVFGHFPRSEYVVIILKNRNHHITCLWSGAQLAGRGVRVFPCPFWKLKKSPLNMGKTFSIDLIVFIYGFDFSFKMLCLAFLGEKTLVFHVLLIKCLSKCPYSKKHSLPWKVPGWVPGDVINSKSFL